MSEADQPRLSKRLSELGLCSRREAEEWIVKGWVRVDGHVVDVVAPHLPVALLVEGNEPLLHQL